MQRRKPCALVRRAKRAAIFSELLRTRFSPTSPHAQWVFSIPTMLRPYLPYRRDLIGDVARLAHDAVGEMMAAAAEFHILRKWHSRKCHNARGVTSIPYLSLVREKKA